MPKPRIAKAAIGQKQKTPRFRGAFFRDMRIGTDLRLPSRPEPPSPPGRQFLPRRRLRRSRRPGRPARHHPEDLRPPGKSRERFAVHPVHVAIVREEFRLILVRILVRTENTTGKECPMFLSDGRVADRGEDIEEFRILLPMLFRQVAGDRCECLPGGRLERELRGALTRDRRQLEKVADEDHLESAEGNRSPRRVRADTSAR